MKQHLYILTGASRGIGLSMASQLLARPSHTVLCISRKTNDALRVPAGADTTLEQWTQDLADGTAAAARLEQWLGQRAGATFLTATLVNNAGVIAHIAPLSKADPADLSNALRVGLEAPMLLTSAFLRATEGWTDTQRKVLNISSGLGRRAMASQSGYCAAKAGMDHFSRCVALEEALKRNGAKVCSLAPGVIDTDMQVQLRSAAPGNFPDQGNFIQLKDKGQLATPDEAASSLLRFLARPDFGSNAVADVRDA
jgi:NAD(P)-dependent dehydrogenase (short-subunit alcohol dehydrogenase family)